MAYYLCEKQFLNSLKCLMSLLILRIRWRICFWVACNSCAKAGFLSVASTPARVAFKYERFQRYAREIAPIQFIETDVSYGCVGYIMLCACFRWNWSACSMAFCRSIDSSKYRLNYWLHIPISTFVYCISVRSWLRWLQNYCKTSFLLTSWCSCRIFIRKVATVNRVTWLCGASNKGSILVASTSVTRVPKVISRSAIIFWMIRWKFFSWRAELPSTNPLSLSCACAFIMTILKFK